MNIVFIVSVVFPYGDAASIRALNICKLLKKAGNTVHVISDYQSEDSEDANEFCTHEYCSEKKMTFLKRHKVVKTCISKLKEYCKNNKVDAILMNARYERFNSISRFCKKNNIKLFVSNTEWFNCTSFKLRYLDIRYYRNQKMIKRDFKKADGFISISRLLDKHNKDFGKKSVRIPTIMDTDLIDYNIEKNNSKIKFIYTGKPGRKKEMLKPIFEFCAKNPQLSEKIEFHIYGPNLKQVKDNIRNKKLISLTKDIIFIHGKVKQQLMPEIMKNADFLVFLRPYIRSSNAGFPTKFGESMAAATPVITNNTGDIELYLKDGVNGFLMNDYSINELNRIINIILSTSSEKKKKMCYEARKTAEEAFNYKNYINEIKYLFS